MTNWPLQKDCDTFYGNPRGANGRASPKWESANLVYVKAPFVITYDGQPLSKGLRVHRKVADSLRRILAKIWDAAGRDQKVVDHWGISKTAGGYNYRLKRGGSSLSMHSYGCAVDFDPANNGMGDTTPRFAQFPEVCAAFESEGWEWGGSWSGSSCDGMHWQAAWTRPGGVRWQPGAKRATPAAPKAEKPAPAPAKLNLPWIVAGSKNDPIVFWVQHTLDAKGWHEVGTVDGLKGSRTETGIMAFRNEQSPKLLPMDGSIDQKLLDAIARSPNRKVDVARATATPDDLAKAGDPTILTAQNIQTAGLVTASFAGVGAVDQRGAIDRAKEAVEGAGVATEVAEKVLNLVQWAAQHWWILVLVIAAVLVWKSRGVIQQRIADHRSGKNLSL